MIVRAARVRRDLEGIAGKRAFMGGCGVVLQHHDRRACPPGGLRGEFPLPRLAMEIPHRAGKSLGQPSVERFAAGARVECRDAARDKPDAGRLSLDCLDGGNPHDPPGSFTAPSSRAASERNGRHHRPAARHLRGRTPCTSASAGRSHPGREGRAADATSGGDEMPRRCGRGRRPGEETAGHARPGAWSGPATNRGTADRARQRANRRVRSRGGT